MPCTPDAVNLFLQRGVLYVPGKAANAGGVATPGLGMSQNAIRYNWTFEKVDQRLLALLLFLLHYHSKCNEGEERNAGKGNSTLTSSI